MKILNLLRRDILISTSLIKKNLLISLIFYIVLILINFYLLEQKSIQLDLSSKIISISDFIFDFFKGISKNELHLLQFRIPISWLVVQLSYCFIFGDLIRSDIYIQSPIILSHGATRKNIWISKLFTTSIISTTITILLYTIFFLSFFIINSFKGWGLNSITISILNLSSILFLFKSFIIQLLTGIMLSWLYLLFSLIVESNIAYFLIISIIVLTLFVPLNINPINFSMIIRINYGTNNETSLIFILLLFCIYLTFISLLSYLIFLRVEFKNGGIRYK